MGFGTGFALAAYPAGCRVTAVDLSGAMLARAHRRLRRTGIQGVSLCRMDAACQLNACEPLEGPSLPWAVTGVIALAGGAALVWFSLVHRRH